MMLPNSWEFKNSPTGWTATITGAIHEGTVFSLVHEAFSASNLPLTFICDGITRINSTGVKKWMTFFGELKTRGLRFTFTAFPPPLVEQLNIVKNFTAGGEVKSVQLPYLCKACRHSFMSEHSTGTLSEVLAQDPTFSILNAETCPKCKKEAEFDEIADEYLTFLSRI